jgi:hypothetical protein
MDAEARFMALVAAYEAQGNIVCQLKDQHDITIGIIVHSLAQQKVFEMYPETLVMDWTYNTNNRDYHLGEPHEATCSLMWHAHNCYVL